jgi:hypothetical protein
VNCGLFDPVVGAVLECRYGEEVEDVAVSDLQEHRSGGERGLSFLLGPVPVD